MMDAKTSAAAIRRWPFWPGLRSLDRMVRRLLGQLGERLRRTDRIYDRFCLRFIEGGWLKRVWVASFILILGSLLLSAYVTSKKTSDLIREREITRQLNQERLSRF